MSAQPLPGDTATTVVLTACGYTHPGRQRRENEDTFGSSPDARLFTVADGMGGHNAGEVASAMAVDEIDKFFREHPHPVLTRPTAQAVEAVGLKADWWERDRDEIKAFLQKWARAQAASE